MLSRSSGGGGYLPECRASTAIHRDIKAKAAVC